MSPKHHTYQWLQTTKMNFEKLFSEQVKNHNCNAFQSSSSLSVPASLFIFCVIYTLILQTFRAVFLNDSLNLVAIPTVLILILACVAGVWKGIEKNAKREGRARREGGRVFFPPSSRALAFLSRLKLPFPLLQTPPKQAILILNFVQLWPLNLFFCCFFSA